MEILGAVFVFIAFVAGGATELWIIKEKIKNGLVPFIDADGNLAWK